MLAQSGRYPRYVPAIKRALELVMQDVRAALICLSLATVAGLAPPARGQDEAAVSEPSDPKDASSASAIKSILPRTIGEEVCYAGTFVKHTLDVADWSRAKLAPVPGVVTAGTQAMRNEPVVQPGMEVTGLTLLLTYNAGTVCTSIPERSERQSNCKNPR
jgi:hypothetical protein